ncbi:MAG: PAS domain-containing protein [Calditrichaceae bacterium]
MAEEQYSVGIIFSHANDLEIIKESIIKIKPDSINVDYIHYSDASQDSLNQSKFDLIFYYVTEENQTGVDEFIDLTEKISGLPVSVLFNNYSTGISDQFLQHKNVETLYIEQLTRLSFDASVKRIIGLHRLNLDSQYLKRNLHQSDIVFLNSIRGYDDGIIIVNKKGFVHFINPACMNKFGIHPEFILGQTLSSELFIDTVREVDVSVFGGDRGTVEMRVGNLVWDDEECHILILRDISEQKESQQQLSAFRLASEHSPIPVLITDKKGIIIYINPQFTEVTGYRESEILGKNPRILNSGTHKTEFYEELWSTILSGNIWSKEICNRKKDGQIYWEKQTIIPVTDAKKEITHFISLRVDDMERKRAEDALRKAESLKSVQELAGGVAHEFSQPLQALTISMSLMEQSAGSSPYFPKAQKMIQRIIELVDNLKSITTIKKQDYLDTKIIDIKASSNRKIIENMKKRILLIDDQKEVLETLVESLNMAGFICDGAEDGLSALEYIGSNQYQLILSDVDMPGMHGIDLFKKIREINYPAYFVFMTGYEIDEEINKILKQADGFINKPFQLSELINLVSRFIKADENSTGSF